MTKRDRERERERDDRETERMRGRKTDKRVGLRLREGAKARRYENTTPLCTCM
jgi:hypothetical protein